MWLVQLAGDALDIDEFPANFGAGPIRAVREDQCVYLTGDALAGFATAEEARD